MLVRAAEIRDSEQQQVFDALDEIHARLAPLESLGSVRKRLSELPDRTEVGVLAERLDEALAKLEAQDRSMAALGRAVEAVVDKLARPFAELGGRLDGVAGRFEGVTGRMGGMEDRLAGVHQRIDDLDHHLDKQDSRLDALPAAVHNPVRERLEAAQTALRSRLDEVDEGVHEHLDSTRDAVTGSLADATGAVSARIADTRDSVQDALAATRQELGGALDAQTGRLDPAQRFDALAGLVEQLGERLNGVTARLDALDAVLGQQPDTTSIEALVRRTTEESEVRQGGQLDEAMATFAELIMGGAAGQVISGPPPPPRPAPRRARQDLPRETARDDDPAVAAS